MDPRVDGANKLIKDALQLIENARDILQAIVSKNLMQNIRFTPQTLKEPANDFEMTGQRFDTLYMIYGETVRPNHA